MALAKNGTVSKKRHKKIIKLAKGYRGRSKNCFRTAVQSVEKALQYAYRDRRTTKRNFRKLWVTRINAAARQNGMIYSQFINGMKLAGIELDRKVLADIAVHDEAGFKAIVEKAAKALEANKKAA
jgi:large subunit ribosomal protein L20